MLLTQEPLEQTSIIDLGHDEPLDHAALVVVLVFAAALFALAMWLKHDANPDWRSSRLNAKARRAAARRAEDRADR